MSYYSYNRGGGFLSSIPPAVKNIIIINVLVMIMTALNQQYMISHFALFYPTSPFFKPWQIITHMFMHGGFWHIFFNMYTKKFLVFYFVTGIGAALLHTGVQFIESQIYISQMADGSQQAAAAYQALKYTPTVGASGAIYGVLIGYAMLFPDSVLTLIFPPVSLKAKWFVLIFAAIELVTGITSAGASSIGGGIAHFAHLGGMLFGWLLILYWKRKRKMY